MPNGDGVQELLLSPYRVLDLTGQGGLLCGKILADLGADVIQVEPPGGSTSRNIGPFYQDDVHPEKSLFWWSYAANKRSITLNLETADGRDLLKRLVKSAHFLIESFPPGYMDGLSLGYTGLEAINPELVMVSITPFGSDGPYARWKAPDIVGMALGGFMYLTGDSDRPPLRVSIPHFHLHGAAAGAAGALRRFGQRNFACGTGQRGHQDIRGLYLVPSAVPLSRHLGAPEQDIGRVRLRTMHVGHRLDPGIGSVEL